MRGDISSFKKQIGDIVKKTLKEYRLDIENSIGSMVIKKKSEKLNIKEFKQDNFER